MHISYFDLEPLTLTTPSRQWPALTSTFGFMGVGTAIAIQGFTSINSGSYTVVLDKDTPFTASARSSFNASTPSTLFYRTGLDPNVMHDIEIVNSAPGANDTGAFLAISKMTVVSPQQTNVP